MLRSHNALARNLTTVIEAHPAFELLYPTTLNLVCFRYHPLAVDDEETLNKLNMGLMHQLNDSGKLYLTHTSVNGRTILRMAIGSAHVEAHHVENSWQLIQQTAELIYSTMV